MGKESRINRIMIAAPASGSGKTLVTCGLLQLLRQRGADVTAFKCGPDYIDPMFHDRVLGVGGGNLDTFFCSAERTAEILACCGHSHAVLEGVMGVYDGLGGLELKASSYDVALATRTPILLVVNAKGTGRTLIPQLCGILKADPEHLIKGILLNRVSEGFYRRLSAAVNESLSEEGYAARVVGYLSDLKEAKLAAPPGGGGTAQPPSGSAPPGGNPGACREGQDRGCNAGAEPGSTGGLPDHGGGGTAEM